MLDTINGKTGIFEKSIAYSTYAQDVQGRVFNVEPS